MNKDSLYSTITQLLTADHLKDLSVQIIDAYRAKNMRLLVAYAQHVEPGTELATAKPNRLFFALMKYFHPDRLEAIRREVEEAYRIGNKESLGFYANLLQAKRAAPVSRRSEPEQAYEEYGYTADDFGFGEYADVDDEYDRPEEEEEFDFLSALRAEFVGNLDIELTPADLVNLDGELVLAGYGFSELDGLEYCVNVNMLDLSDNEIANIYEIQALTHLQELFLSGNHISDITPLKGLAELEILDLSFNDVEDISTLLQLESLKFVNLQGNPLESVGLIRRLEKRSVTVIY